MELTKNHCQGEDCGKFTYIVNKKYCLCDECNYKRLHGGKSKQEIWSERSTERNQGTGKNSIDKQVFKSDPGKNIVELKKKYSIKSISNKGKFHCSDGTIVSQVEIKRRYAETCDKIKQTRPQICQGSGRSDVPLSFSHTISQADCKSLGKTELIWNEDNIEIEGFEAPTSRPEMAHNIWEVGTIDQKIMLLNFERKLNYIERHDPEGYIKLVIKIEELELKLSSYDKS